MKRWEGKRVTITAERLASQYHWTPEQAAELAQQGLTEAVVRVVAEPNGLGPTYEYDLPNVNPEAPVGFAWGKGDGYIFDEYIHTGVIALADSILDDWTGGDEEALAGYDYVVLDGLWEFLDSLDYWEPFSIDEDALRVWIERELGEL